MNRPIKLVGAGLALAVSVAIGFSVGQLSAGRDIEALARRLDQMQRQQEALQDAFVTGNPKARRALAHSMGYARAQSPQRSIAEASGEQRLSPENMQRQGEAVRLKLEQEYESEPLNPAWAGSTMHLVEDAIVDVAAAGGPTPRSTQVDCRNSTCRIRLNLADSGEVGGFVDPLLVGISNSLPRTRMVEVPSADGRIELRIFATKASSRVASR